ncbi:ABC transporter substrate-binding protein [Komagataeibacter intermedius]|nr:ABC transporter substrate-binding protein [Komagataeibacter intermedius]
MVRHRPAQEMPVNLTWKENRMKALTLTCAVMFGCMPLAAHGADDLTLGFLTAHSGPFASLSRTNGIAVDMAVEQINASGGVNGHNLRVITFDTAGDARQAALGVRQLAQDNQALAVIGPFSSSEVRTAFPTGERLGIAEMAIASSAPGLAKSYSFAFRNTTDEGIVVDQVMAALRTAHLPMATGAVAYATDDVVSKTMGTTVLPQVFHKYGVEMKGSIDFQLAAFDLSSQVSQLKEMHPDLLALGTPPEVAINLAREMKRQGVDARIVGGTTVADPELPARLQGNGENLTIGTTFYAQHDERTRSFAQEFSSRAHAVGMTRTVPNQMDAVAYDIVYLYAQAMKQGRLTGDKAHLAEERTAMRDALAKISDFPALEGNITINAEHDAIKPVYVLEIYDGAWKLLPAGTP